MKNIIFSLVEKLIMNKEEIVKTLMNFGLTEYESKTYATLAIFGPAKASEISKHSGVPQSKIYSTLESLMEKQLIEVFDGRPKIFRAVTPSSVIKNLVKVKERELLELKRKALAISSLLRPIEEEEEVIEGIWVQSGEKYAEVFDRLASMLSRARRYVYDVTRDFSYSSKYRKEILRCKKRGVKLHIMAMRIDEDNYLRAKWYVDHGIKVRCFNAEIHPRIMVVDGREVAIRIDHENRKSRFSFHSIWSKNPSFVRMMDSYLKHLWENAEMMKIFYSNV